MNMKQIAVAVALATVSAGAMAAGEVEAGITATSATVTTYIGLAIAAGFTLLGLSLASDVGMGLVKKWIKKGAK
ncbi:hypothetical protein LJR071_004162 [Pseudomonas sp. LjRoot71]|uniref:hypothetical protein n=1 Tax=Pseudomonas sp. LjRoot71 TaxID=3342336 RepID=UPI003ECF4E1F